MASASFAPARTSTFGAAKKMIVPVRVGECTPEISSSALARALAVAIIGTSVSAGSGAVVQLAEIAQFVPHPAPTIAVGEMLRVIRRKTALTWDNLASIFEVSRRSLHHWASGQTVSVENEHKVSALHKRVLALRDEPAFVARSTLLAEYGISPTVEPASGATLPFLVADQTPIATKVKGSRSPELRTR